MDKKELIEKYIDFFKRHKHKEIPNASLVPVNDPTVLFTTAGMHPLIPFLLGQKHPLGKRLVNVQKCIRTGDIDKVGDECHLTFFEMLGNWSLGDYFKKDSTFNDKLENIDNFHKSIINYQINIESVKTFFSDILAYEVSKPSLSLYLSSLLKAKLLEDSVEYESWNDKIIPEYAGKIKRFDELPDFNIPNYIEKGFSWLITENV